jgi:hypothetical protein
MTFPYPDARETVGLFLDSDNFKYAITVKKSACLRGSKREKIHREHRRSCYPVLLPMEYALEVAPAQPRI